MRAAFWVLVVAAAVQLVLAIAKISVLGQITDAQLRDVAPTMTLAQAREALHEDLIFNIVLSVVQAAAYGAFAYLAKNGKNWAKMTITGIVIVLAVFYILGGTDVITLGITIVELVGIGLLYAPTSKQFFLAARSV